MTTEAAKPTAGFGRDKGLHAPDGYTQLKTTWFDLSEH